MTIRRIRVLVVAADAALQEVLFAVLAGQEDVEVVGGAFETVSALDRIQQASPDVVIADLDMPRGEGINILRALRLHNLRLPQAQRIGVLALTGSGHRDSQIVVQAIQLGAFDFVVRHDPVLPPDPVALRRQLLIKLRYYASRRNADRNRPKRFQAATTLRPQSPIPFALAPRQTPPPRPPRRVRAVLIGISTGGPKALTAMLPDLSRRIRQPILVVQHMPKNFTTTLARGLNDLCRHQVLEVTAPMPIRDDIIYIAPGGLHLCVVRGPDGQPMASLSEIPPENACRPAADVLFRSSAMVLGGEQVALVLTGMGVDGTKGLVPLKRAGAWVIAQDQASSVVWGMPGSAVNAGLVDEILPLLDIPEAVARLANGRDDEEPPWN